ncbi:MAG: hypothetical protein RIQ89_482 [Bacteroidota bacterium]
MQKPTIMTWRFWSISGTLFSFIVIITSISSRVVDTSSYPVKLYQVDSGFSKLNYHTGIIWTLSYLGAMLPADEPCIIYNHDSSIATIDFRAAGFNDSALAAIAAILDSVDHTIAPDTIDIARLLVLLAYSSPHYYAITGAPKKFSHLKRVPIEMEKKLLLLKSSIAKGKRKLHYYINKWNDSYFIAEELDDSAQTMEFEVMDFLPNTQPRFMIYNKQGLLVSAANSAITSAGKPGKCMWCHESKAQPLFETSTLTDVAQQHFLNEIVKFNKDLYGYRRSLNTQVAFDQLQAHTNSELLYISFMQSSLQRIAGEWEVSKETAQERLAPFNSTYDEEFKWLGKAFERELIDSLCKRRTVRITQNVREQNTFEPDYLNYMH